MASLSPSKYSSGKSWKPIFGSISYIGRFKIAYLSMKCILKKIFLSNPRCQIGTIANKLVKPFTFVGILENFWSKASDMLWAGSVEIIKTLSLTLESWTAKLQLKIKNQILNIFIIQHF